ncbi:MAG: ribosomal protein S18-alanine N-acetyltransferase [Gallionella sp.]|nr:ribosomal protein S18-alanine N-acetyltransferase [Gallionella sp.]OIO11952.1 MAG: ribosomal-protein-alanine N-acetyltransferase [Gallionellaceae bacterium CG1_02_60_325]PIR10260.1 MAG: ribosomal-protein-alanine N-acetyltransferase [Gallionellaceae bacterium CG11_big_fil_rev_8_21_14_0_20_60_62]PIV48171.1 MAG: ribosomal-protein-alanine N-acetyltransferase [Gallionellaceae bacterium CG02_land_8_20_14_3_00_60_115]PIY06682.1 MAG: ribosomal-protein-alanine N-acetyltransferase [Gallionellaceae bac
MILRDMTDHDLDEVLRIETAVHAHPWTRGNFSDALRSAYPCKLLEPDRIIAGYAVMMAGVDEAELLNIAIDAGHQRKGLGRRLLEAMLVLARHQNMRRMLLEVRASNAPAIALYRATGFGQIGLRRDYYPAPNGREDALLMGKQL